MTRLNTRPSAILALVASIVFTGCGGTVDFTIDEMMDVDTTVNAGTTVSSVDLAAEAGSAWKQRKKIDEQAGHISMLEQSQLTMGVTMDQQHNEICTQRETINDLRQSLLMHVKETFA